MPNLQYQCDEASCGKRSAGRNGYRKIHQHYKDSGHQPKVPSMGRPQGRGGKR